MPGFLGKIGTITSELFSKNKRSELVNNNIVINNNIYIERRTVNKFLNDKVFKEDGDFFVLTEGIILNSLNLIKKYQGKSFFDVIKTMYKKNGDHFFKEFRGSFSGVFIDKKLNKKIIFTNHIGDKQVFYYKQKDNELIFGSELNYILEYFQENEIQYNLNTEAAYQLLTYGYMLEDNTLINGIKKLSAGNYILIKNDSFKVIQYYKLNNTPSFDHSEEEVVENIDFLFRQAIKRAFEKDKEYGYKHLVALSGGLDSRMTTWVANDMGYGDNIINYTFSQTDYLDETIPKEIASDLKHEWIFKALDNGIFLKNIDEVVSLSSGGALFYGLSHAKSFLDLINQEKLGIIHTGQLGDVILGTFFSSRNPRPYSLSDGAYSTTLLHKINKDSIHYFYENEEIFKLINRAFNGTNQGLLIAQEGSESYSPFCDTDFIDYCLKIPVELRLNHRIYFKWILSKYPGAASYKWESIKGKITDKKINIMDRDILLKHVPSKIYNLTLKKFGFKKNSINTKNHMNPLDYWYNTNEDLRSFMDDYFHTNINRLKFNEDLLNDCKFLYTKGNNTEKNQVLTLLAFLKLYFGETNDVKAKTINK
ncbi:hypothetical protein J22TS1_17180 [Siminovitchia terrae]|uniref:hypothetical protein n=1 Tax=Siminovitchia terrae TaxID=1914933 RepID=UPI001B2ECF1F|nr:hypothetical protein [Siminovitchia terrae]GIN90667.1 hypothetical protein J22TS1_17180 [Siminovitchia terrae]